MYDGAMWVAALVFAVVSHTLAAAVCARALGIAVAELAVGVGPGVSILMERRESTSGGERPGAIHPRARSSRHFRPEQVR